MGQKVIIRFWWESGWSSASRNHLTTFCRPFVHYACRLCSAIARFIQGFLKGVLGTPFGSLESKKIIIGPLESEKSSPYKSIPGT